MAIKNIHKWKPCILLYMPENKVSYNFQLLRPSVFDKSPIEVKQNNSETSQQPCTTSQAS